MIGQTLSHYKILGELSRGGMGIVYRARDVNLNRDVALKVLPPELVADPERKRRLVQEAQAAAALEHPHIAVVYEIDEADGATFIVMELIQGEKLSDLLAARTRPLSRLLDLATEVAEGLSSAHDKGIVHRDLKPANVMVTEQGHAKIIDFGVAKLLRPLSGDESDVPTVLQHETDAGLVMGTVSYMSPEQARGGKVDHRTDVFAFGVCLYEMLSGALPFRGASAVETLNAILHSAPPPLGPASGTGPEVASDLQRIVEKCLAKDAAERYQTMKDLAIDLRHARRRLESGTVGALPPVAAKSRARWVVAAVALGGLLALGFALWRPARDVRSTPSSKPSVAVLYFDNVTGDPSLDWLHTGLADMLVTDLSQSPRLEVLSTDRLYQILKEMNRLDERITSLDVVQGVAEKAGVEIVLLGSFMKSGENIRINLRIQEASSGRILTSEKVEGVGDDSLFPMVDDLTRRVMARLDVGPADESLLARRLEEVTTSSVEAFRFYSEGMKLHYELKEEEAIPLFERAIEVDPDFAMALARLATIHGNLGHEREAFELGTRALARADRLPPVERNYIEGLVYSRREETWSRAIETYERALEEQPEQESLRNNVAFRYWLLELYDESIAHLEKIRGRTEFVGSYGILAAAYDAQGRFDEGERVVRELLERRPDSAPAHRYLGFQYYKAGRLDEAREAFGREAALDPSSPWPHLGRSDIERLAEDWNESNRAAERLTQSRNPFFQWIGHAFLATNALYRGDSEKSLQSLDHAARSFSEPDSLVGASESFAGDVLVETGRYREALERLEKARRHGEGNQPEWEALFLRALAEQRLGRARDADESLGELERRTASIPGPKAKRRVLQLRGNLSLLRGENASAIESLTSAESMLPRRAFPGPDGPPAHVPIWFSLASAHLAAGNDEEALRWFRRIAESEHEHSDWPIPYVRSFYFLGKIHESRGETKESQTYYRRFVEYWGDGDFDRARVQEARGKL